MEGEDYEDTDDDLFSQELVLQRLCGHLQSSALQRLRTVVGNIASNPEDDKFRRLRVENKLVQQLLVDRNIEASLLHLGFMYSSGFLVMAPPSSESLNTLRRELDWIDIRLHGGAQHSTAQVQPSKMSTSTPAVGYSSGQALPLMAESPQVEPTASFLVPCVGSAEEMLLANAVLLYKQLERLDGPVEVMFFKPASARDPDVSSDNYVYINDHTFNRFSLGSAFAAVPLLHEAAELRALEHHRNRDDGAKLIAVPLPGAHARLGQPQPLVLGSDGWWTGLRESIYATTRNAPPSQELFQSALLRTFVVPVHGEPEYRRVLITTNFSGMSLSKIKSGAQFVSFQSALWAAALTPPVGEWPTSMDVAFTSDVSSLNDRWYGLFPPNCQLFPHQERTVQWMHILESRSVDEHTLTFPRLVVAGVDPKPAERLKDLRSMRVPLGGVIGHPVGSGKTRIVLTLVAMDHKLSTLSSACETPSIALQHEEQHGLKTLVICPPHLVEQWEHEALQVGNAEDVLVIAGFQDIPAHTKGCWRRFVVDEPQDMNAEDLQSAGAVDAQFRWVLCGTGPLQLRRCAQLIFKSELPSWKLGSRETVGVRVHPPVVGMASTPVWERLAAGFVSLCCIADPVGECLPMPPLHSNVVPIHMPAEEAIVVQMHTRANNLQKAVRAMCGIDLKVTYSGESGLRRVEQSYEDQLHDSELEYERQKKAGDAIHISFLESLGRTCSCTESADFWRCFNELEELSDMNYRTIQGIEKHLGVIRTELGRIKKDIDAKKRLLSFARDARSLLEDQDAACGICFNGLWRLPVAMWPGCLHAFCSGCVSRLQETKESLKIVRCPQCRGEERRANILTFAPRGAATYTQCSKMRSMVDMVSTILEDIDEHVVIFGQWTGILEMAQDALEDASISCLTLCKRTLEERLDALRRFGCIGEPRVILLSSESHSSGINLQVARHIIMLHPYCPERHITSGRLHERSLDEARAYDHQAIGRVRRYPQTRDVHVHRLFVAGTIEEELLAAQELL